MLATVTAIELAVFAVLILAVPVCHVVYEIWSVRDRDAWMQGQVYRDHRNRYNAGK